MEARAKGRGPKPVSLLDSPCAGDSLCSNQDKLVLRVSQVAVSGQAGCYSSKFSQEAGRVDLLESVPEVHGRCFNIEATV